MSTVIEAPEVVAPVEEPKELVRVSGVASKLIETEGFGLVTVSLEGLALPERKAAVRAIAQQASTAEDRIKLVAGEILYEVTENKYWKEWTTKDPDTGEERPYNSFDEYVETELGMSRRTALYLTRIYETLVVKHGLPTEVLKSIQWSKAKEVLDYITPANVNEVLDVLRDPKMTVKRIGEWVKLQKTVVADDDSGTTSAAASGSESASPDKPSVMLKFKVTEEQAEIVRAALTLAGSIADSDVPGNQLALICGDFLGSATGGGIEGAIGRIDHVIKSIQAAYGVELTITNPGVLEERASKEAAPTE